MVQGVRRRDKEQVFCQELTDCPEGFSLNERIAVVRDLNAKVGVLVYGILRLWEMSCINNSEERLLDVCTENLRFITSI